MATEHTAFCSQLMMTIILIEICSDPGWLGAIVNILDSNLIRNLMSLLCNHARDDQA